MKMSDSPLLKGAKALRPGGCLAGVCPRWLTGQPPEAFGFSPPLLRGIFRRAKIMDKRKPLLLFLIFMLLFVTCRLKPGQAQEIFKQQRVPPTDFAILSWGPSPAEPQQLQWMKEAGINIAGFAQVKDLAAFENAGLQVFVSDPRVSRYDFEKSLDEKLVRENIQSLAKEV